MDSPNIKGFQAQLDCKLTYGNKNQTQLTLVQHIYSCMFKKKIFKLYNLSPSFAAKDNFCLSSKLITVKLHACRGFTTYD